MGTNKRQEEFFNWSSDIEVKDEIIMINDNSSLAKKQIAKIVEAYVEAFSKIKIKENEDET